MVNGRILVLDHDAAQLRALADLLARSGYQTETATSAAAGLDKAARSAPDLMIVNHRLPDMDGHTVSRRARAMNRFPILVLTPEDTLENGVADGYLRIPFASRDLKVQVENLMKRSGVTALPIRLGNLTVDTSRKRAVVADTILDLTNTEFGLLMLLAQNPSQPMERPALFRAVWGYEMEFNTNSLEVMVYRLRNKIKKAGGNINIRTLRGFGYVMEPMG